MSDEKTKRNSAALAVAAGIFLSRLSGLVRERVFAYYLGNTDAAGALRAAMRIPNLMQNLFGEGVLSASFIPVYSRLLGKGDERGATQVATRTGAWLVLVTLILTGLGYFAASFLVDTLAPGFEGETRALCVSLVKIIFPGTGLLVLSAWCLGILNSHRRFFLSYVAPVIWNVAIIAFLIWGSLELKTKSPVELVRMGAWGIVAGSFLQWLVQLPMALSLNRGLAWGKDVSQGEKEVLKNFVPALFSRGVAQLNAYVDQILSSFLGAQVVSGFAYSQTLSLLPLSLFGMAITASELPEMSRESGGPERNTRIQERLSASRDKLLFFLVPSTVGLVFLGNHIVGAVFQTGQFGAKDTQLVWAILAASSLGLLATSESRLLASVFWALGETRRPAVFAFWRMVLSTVVGCTCVFYLARKFHIEPFQTAVFLGLGSSASAYFENFLLHRSLNKVIPLNYSNKSLLRFLGAALVSAVAAHFSHPLFVPLHKPWAVGGGVLAIYGVAYLTLTGGWKRVRNMRRVK